MLEAETNSDGMLKKNSIYAIIISLLGVVAVWGFFIVQFESSLGTNNTVNVEYSQTYTNQSSDILATLSFGDDDEDLDWASVEVIINKQNQQFPCSFGSTSLDPTSPSKVSPKLSVDGKTFTTEIDATSEEEFVFFDIFTQKESDATNGTMKFSKTDFYVSAGVNWTFIEDVEFSSVNNSTPMSFSQQTEDRLKWYTYDMKSHRVEPNSGVYVFSVDEHLFKVQFLSYYNDDDEGRYPTFLVSSIEPTPFPALQDPELVAPSPCIIHSTDVERTYWDKNETIHLYENDVNICSDSCSFEVVVIFETIVVKSNKI